jgi:hypothetical protein
VFYGEQTSFEDSRFGDTDDEWNLDKLLRSYIV